MVQSLWDFVARCSGRKNQQRHGIEQAPAAYAGSDHPQSRFGCPPPSGLSLRCQRQCSPYDTTHPNGVLPYVGVAVIAVGVAGLPK